MNKDSLKDQPRLLLVADLAPIAGTRFQPTGFPDLGAATYKSADGRDMLLVESAQSMANRLETVCWDEIIQKPVSDLEGLPYVEAILPDGTRTNSLLEAHRLNSPYIVNSPEFVEIEKTIGFEKNKPFNRINLAKALLKFDPCSLLHGVFLEKIGGVVRLPRVLTAFIEADNISRAPNGGVKLDRIQPETTGKVTPYGKAEEGYGNVPHYREEFTGNIKAYFNLDLALLRAVGTSESGIQFLLVLAFYKIRRFLSEGLRLRTACDLEVTRMEISRPKETHLELPSLSELATQLKSSIEENASQFGPSPFITTYDSKVAKARKAAKEKEKKKNDEDADSDKGED